MTFTTTKTVRELALEMPNATRIFEKLKIDYCCGGSRPLEEACIAARVEVDSVMRLLEESAKAGWQNSATTDFQTSPLTELMTYIVDKHHAFTRQEMDRLRALLDKVCSVHGQNHPELLTIQGLFRELCLELAPHMFKEEQVLFPYIERMEEAENNSREIPLPAFGTLRNPVRMMMMEHDAAGELLKKLRETSSDYTVPQDGCISYQTLYQAMEAFEQDLHQHIHLENNVLFPRAVEMEG
ncbi:MAG TPA: iron-sulfur cluster repair di-iron protein [Pyrinomonadaceae bacterium]|nr:iron-sulfur cluster repair di-iron protein [Pyrinomonadaceae bacterium]